MTFPAFMGIVSGEGRSTTELPVNLTCGWQQLWSCNRPRLSVWAREALRGETFHWWSSEFTEDALSVFLRGRPLIASDPEFGSETTIERVPDAEMAQRIAKLYRSYEAAAFALLEGSFSLVIWDQRAGVVLVGVDKFGCDDIYVRRNRESIEFASHPMLLDRSPARLNAVETAFFLAQEGFVPAPFTLFEGVESIGRARLLRIKTDQRRLVAESETYWRLPQTTIQISTAGAVDRFHSVIGEATSSRGAKRNGILLSGGADSSLLANLIIRRNCGETVALTGAVVGNAESEWEVRRAAVLSMALGIPHEPVYLDPMDEDVPDEWVRCTDSWSAGTRVTMPLFYRFAKTMREIFGAEWAAFSGQMADTLADSNYTISSPGYAVRRMFFSSWFFKALPFVRLLSRGVDSAMGELLLRLCKELVGIRLSGMIAGVLNGFSNPTRFYEGRIFGCGEMPGRSRASCPALSNDGFEEVADWYSRNYVAPVVERLTPESFYAGMIELSMDMCMLHLDTRLALHAMRLCGGNLEFPFLDSRVVKVFAELPYSARALYRKPKYVIHAQFEKYGYKRVEFIDRENPNERSGDWSGRSASSDELLLKGTLGAYIRDLLRDGRLFDQSPELLRLIDPAYVERQARAFQADSPDVNYKFITRIAALEQWCKVRTMSQAPRAVAFA